MGSTFGIDLEGGSDTPLQNVYINKLHPLSPADSDGHLKVGDQVVMCGKECFVGVTSVEAWDILRRAPLTVDIVVARKKEALDKLHGSRQDLHTIVPHPPDVQQPKLWAQPPLSLHYTGGSSENLSLPQPTHYSSLEEIHDVSATPSQPEINEETLTVVLRREVGQRLGFGIYGGADKPSLPQVHVSGTVNTYTHCKDMFRSKLLNLTVWQQLKVA